MKQEYFNVNLRHILAFLEVAKTSSFTLAAASLNMSQPALSATIKQLENHLGVRLFDRTTRSVLMTLDGADLLPKATKLATSFYETINEFKEIAEKRKGSVSVSSLLSYAVKILPKLIRIFSNKYPSLSLSIRDENSAAVVDRVKKREVDFGISSPDSSNELYFEPLFNEPFGVVCRRDWFEGYDKEIELHALTHHNYIGFLSETGIHAKIIEQENLPENILHPRCTVATISAFEGLLFEGLGFSILPWLTCPKNTTYGIKFLKIVNPVISREIGLLTCPNRSLSLAAKAFYELLKENSRSFLPSNLDYK